jgi:uncharacterized membrane protein YkvA (DUF1232 family)
MEDYSNSYSEFEFWYKVKSVGRSVPFLRDAIAMFYSLTDQDTPLWVKAVIIGALGYFISPIDVVPDFIPFIGYVDDAGVIAGALSSIAAHVTTEHYKKTDNFLS